MKKEFLITYIIVGVAPIFLAYLNKPLWMVACIYLGGTYFILRSNYKKW